MSTVLQLKKEIEVEKGLFAQQQREFLQEKASISASLAANKAETRMLEQRLSSLSVDHAATAQDAQTQRSRGDSLQVCLV